MKRIAAQFYYRDIDCQKKFKILFTIDLNDYREDKYWTDYIDLTQIQWETTEDCPAGYVDMWTAHGSQKNWQKNIRLPDPHAHILQPFGSTGPTRPVLYINYGKRCAVLRSFFYWSMMSANYYYRKEKPSRSRISIRVKPLFCKVIYLPPAGRVSADNELLRGVFDVR